MLFVFLHFSGYFIKETFYQGSVTETSKGAVLKGGGRVPSHPTYMKWGGSAESCGVGGPPDGAAGVVPLRRELGRRGDLTLRHSLSLLLVLH